MKPRVKSKPADDALPGNPKADAALRKQIIALETALKQASARRKKIVLESSIPGNTLLFGVVGDPHCGSTYEAVPEMQAMYERFASEGVKDVLCAGDLVDGINMYRTQPYEIHAHGWAAQRDHFVKIAPRVEGITTHFITGNHDASMKAAAGVDVGGEIAERRRDWHFCGEDAATVEFITGNGRRFRVSLIHPGGGSAYAISYRAQKIVEQLEGGTKPNMMCIGHFHKADFLPSYRNVAVLQTGTFQWQTPFMVRQGLSAMVGGWTVRVTMHPRESMANSIRAEFTAFYRQTDK